MQVRPDPDCTNIIREENEQGQASYTHRLVTVKMLYYVPRCPSKVLFFRTQMRLSTLHWGTRNCKPNTNHTFRPTSSGDTIGVSWHAVMACCEQKHVSRSHHSTFIQSWKAAPWNLLVSADKLHAEYWSKLRHCLWVAHICVCSTAALFIFGSKKSCVSPVFISPLRPSRLSKRFLEGKSCNGQGCRLCETNFDMPRTAPESTTRGFLRHGGSPSRHGCQYSNGLTSLTLKVLQ